MHVEEAQLNVQYFKISSQLQWVSKIENDYSV